MLLQKFSTLKATKTTKPPMQTYPSQPSSTATPTNSQPPNWAAFQTSSVAFPPLKRLYCDNLGLVKKVSYFSKYRLAPVKCVLHSEYDVVFQAFQLLSAYPAQPEILHVKGHQDDKIPYINLPLPAQLNVDADRLATRELFEQPKLIHHAPLFPSSKAQLPLGGTSITHDLHSGSYPKTPRLLTTSSLHARTFWLDRVYNPVGQLGRFLCCL